MKVKLIFAVLFGAIILIACTTTPIPTPTLQAIPTKTSIVIPPTTKPEPTIIWIIKATPLNLSSGKSNQIISILDQLHPYLCLKKAYNLLTLTPPALEMRLPPLKFTEIAALPEPKPGYEYQRAENFDKSRTAFAGCQPGDCSKLYIVDNKIGEIYAVNFGATTDRPLDWLQWINRDTVTITQQGHLWINTVAINVEKQQFEYYGMTTGCTLTPNP